MVSLKDDRTHDTYYFIFLADELLELLVYIPRTSCAFFPDERVTCKSRAVPEIAICAVPISTLEDWEVLLPVVPDVPSLPLVSGIASV